MTQIQLHPLNIHLTVCYFERQDFTFTVERCVQMVISCGFFHVPRPDIFRISMTNEANGVNAVGSYRSGNRPTRALFRQGSVTSFDLDVQISVKQYNRACY